MLYVRQLPALKLLRCPALHVALPLQGCTLQAPQPPALWDPQQLTRCAPLPPVPWDPQQRTHCSPLPPSRWELQGSALQAHPPLVPRIRQPPALHLPQHPGLWQLPQPAPSATLPLARSPGLSVPQGLALSVALSGGLPALPPPPHAQAPTPHTLQPSAQHGTSQGARAISPSPAPPTTRSQDLPIAPCPAPTTLCPAQPTPPCPALPLPLLMLPCLALAHAPPAVP